MFLKDTWRITLNVFLSGYLKNYILYFLCKHHMRKTKHVSFLVYHQVSPTCAHSEGDSLMVLFDEFQGLKRLPKIHLVQIYMVNKLHLWGLLLMATQWICGWPWTGQFRCSLPSCLLHLMILLILLPWHLYRRRMMNPGTSIEHLSWLWGSSPLSRLLSHSTSCLYPFLPSYLYSMSLCSCVSVVSRVGASLFGVVYIAYAPSHVL